MPLFIQKEDGGKILLESGGGLLKASTLPPPTSFEATRSSDGQSTSLSWGIPDLTPDEYLQTEAGANFLLESGAKLRLGDGANYVIFRADGHVGTYSELTRVGESVTSHTDSHGSENTTYSYKIATVDVNGAIGKRVTARHTEGLRTML